MRAERRSIPLVASFLLIPSNSSESHRFACRILEHGAAAFAHDAAIALARNRPEFVGAFGESATAIWRDLLKSHIRDLAHAVDGRGSAEFSRQIAWARIAYAARSFPQEFLRESLRELRGVLDRELPAPAKTATWSCFDEALAGLDAATFDVDEASAPAKHPMARVYLRHLLNGDRRAASRDLVDAVRNGAISLTDAYVDVCLAAQREIGCLWHRNEISIAVEHFVTATALSTMAELLATAPVGPSNGKVVLSATVAGDRHDVGLRCTSDLLAIEGFKSVYLGADVPVDDIAAGVQEFEVDLVLLSAILPAHRRGVADAITAVRSTDRPDQKVKVMVGGAAFDLDSNSWRTVGADAYAATPRAAVEWAREWSNG